MEEHSDSRKLFQPLKIANGNITLKHRAVYAPMTRMRGLPLPNALADDGFTRSWCPDELAVEYYAQRATDGGLLITEGIAVSEQGLVYPGVPGLYRAEQRAAWSRVTAAVHAKDGFIYAQLWHGGRTAVPQYTGVPSVSSSSQPVGDGGGANAFHPAPDPYGGGPIRMADHPPQRLDRQGIDLVITQFVECARAALACGFDGVEVHGANGYLGDQFLASNINDRDDEYGGSAKARGRFILRLLDALGASVGRENVAVRLSPYGMHHGVRARDRVATCTALCRSIRADLSISGPLSYVHLIRPRLDQLHLLADRADYLAAWRAADSLAPFRAALGNEIALIGAGGYTPAADSCFGDVAAGRVDAVAFGRLFLANPDFVDRLRRGRPMNHYNRLTFYGPFSPEPRPVGYIDYPTWEEAVAVAAATGQEGPKWFGERQPAYFNFRNLAPLGELVQFAFSGRTACNRFCKAAMTERISTWDPMNRDNCGIPTKEVERLFARFGEGEPGLIVTGAITIDPNYLEAPGNSIIPPGAPYQGERFDGFVAMATAAKAHGSLLLGQLNHTGRQTMALLQPDPVSASEEQLLANDMSMEYAKPHAATEQEIADIVAAFGKGAAYLEAAGFDGVQLNAAHGYLLAQFLSLRTNKRSDRWGAASMEDRARLLLDVVRAIRQLCSRKFIVSVKINCIEYQPEGITLAEAKQVCTMLEAAEADIVELSGGTYEEFGWKHKPGHTTEEREGYFLDAADAIRPVLNKTRLYATGGFSTVPAMLKALKVVDGIGMARALCQEPDLCKRILSGKSEGRARQLADQKNYTLTAMIAGSQMRQMCHGQEPLDGGQQEVVDKFQQSIGQYIADMTTGNPDGRKFGWMEVR